MPPATIVILAITVAALLMYYYLFVWQIRRAAKRILGYVRNSCSRDRNIHIIDAGSLPADAAEKYAEAKTVVEEMGFKFVCYAEDETFTRTNGIMVPFQYFRDDKGEIKAATYFHPKIGRNIYDFITELSDGRQLITSNAAMAAKLIAPPVFIRRHFPLETPPSVILKAHKEQIQKALAGSPGITCTTTMTPEAILDRYRLDQKIRYEFNRKRGWISLEELVALCPKGSEASARRVYAMIQKILRDEEKAVERGR